MYTSLKFESEEAARNQVYKTNRDLLSGMRERSETVQQKCLATDL